MSRLDDHVAAVQNRMALNLFAMALGWGAMVFAGVLFLAVLIDRIFLVRLPQPVMWVYGGLALILIAAAVYAARMRPSPREAAVPIDEKLGLKEKISTALYIRPENDPFAQAAVLDAEQTAQQVVINMRQHFPLTFPRPAYWAIGLLVLALLARGFIDPMNLFNRKEIAAKQAAEQAKVEEARKNVERAIARIDAMPKVAGSEEALQIAKAELTAMLNQPTIDPSKANRTAVKALQDLNEALKEQAKTNAKYAQAQNEMKMLKSMQKPMEGQGPVADAHRAIVDGNFSEAIDELTKAIENFEKMDKEQQQQVAQQMQQLSQQLQQQAQPNAAQQQKMQQQMQQMGMNQQQQQQAQQLMQQAAQGDKQAQQQMQQLMQQVQQQMNNGQGANQQQQQMMQQMMQQMQAQQNAQQTAQQMAQAAQQMAQAMKQAAQQAQGQQGQQPGQQQNPQQGMAQAMNAMQQQLQNMQAAAQDAQQIAAAQAAAQAAQAAAQQAMNGNGNAGQGGQGQGMWNPGNNNGNPNNPNQQFNGQAGFAGPNQGGIGAGDRTYKNQAPYGVKQEIDPSQDDPNGRILASNFIKDLNPDRGTSTQTLKEVAERALNEQTDEVDQERISRQAASAVREYFKSIPDVAAE
jgi:hypothetical protein